jgi:O-antigen/teichoic acid export membrane protein
LTQALDIIRRRFAASLGRTLLFNFSARTAVAIIGLLVTPVYLRLLGPQAFGLVGFWAAAQSWMILFDLGISPAVARQLSRYRAGVLSENDAASLLGFVEGVFLGAGLLGVLAFAASVPWVASHWLGRSQLPPAEIRRALYLIGVLLLVRWMSGLYQTALVGLERQIASNLVALLGFVLRSVGSLAALLVVTPTPLVFFAVQAVTCVAELIASRAMLSRFAPSGARGFVTGRRLLLAELRFATGLAVSSSVATVINQSDKVVLSHTLPLADFGLFSLVVTICGGIGMVVPPFVQSVQPRLTTLHARGQRAELVRLYRRAFALLIALVGGSAGTIAAQPEMVLYAWTGDGMLARRIAPVLALYGAGTGISSFLFLPYVLQYAFGTVRLHVIGNILFGIVWVPATVFAATRFGSAGTGFVWLAGNLAFLFLWTPVVHARFLDVLERRGLASRSMTSAAMMAAMLASSRLIPSIAIGRWGALAVLAVTAIGVGGVGVASAPELRTYVLALTVRRNA